MENNNMLKLSPDGTVLKSCATDFVGECVIPNSVTEIGGSAFWGCTGLTSIEIPSSVTEIAESAFKGCTGLTSIEIPNSVKVICHSAFNGCTGLTSIEIPNSVTEIGGVAFWGCTGLTSIEIPNSVTEIGTSAFSDCTSLKSISVAENNSNYCDVDGVLFDKEVKRLKSYPQAKNETSYSIPASVERISVRAFRWPSKLESLCIHRGVKFIDSYAFSKGEDVEMQDVAIHIWNEDPNAIEIDDKAFGDGDTDIRPNCTLYVPVGTGYAYRHHPVFGKFKEVVIEKMPKA